MKKINKLVYTALCLALLVVIQAVTKPLGQLVTGSLVNTILVVTTLTAGFYGGIAVALISPFVAFVFGIGTPFFLIVPMIALGNAVLVSVYAAVFHRIKLNDYYKWGISVPVAALCKFIVLYLGIVKIILPNLGETEKKIAALSATFSFPQLITAVVGGILAFIIVPAMKKALKI